MRLLLALLLLAGCSRDVDERSVVEQHGAGWGIVVRVIHLKDGTRCALLGAHAIDCDWKQR